MSHPGGVALLETIRTCGLDRTWHEVLLPWHKPTAVHDSAKALLDLALSLAFGGDCLADIAVLRAEPGLYGPVASDPTVSRTVDALAADAPRAMAASAARGRRPAPGSGSSPDSTRLITRRTRRRR